MSIESLCSHNVVTFKDRTRTTTAGGGGTYAYSGTTKYRCFVQPLSTAERIQWEQRDCSLTHQLYTTYEPPWGNGDRLDWGGTKLRVEGKPINQVGADRVWKTMAEELGHRQ